MIVPCVPDPRIVSIANLSTSTPDLAPGGFSQLELPPMGKKERRREPQQPLSPRTLIALVATATYRAFTVLATGDSPSVPQH